MPEEARQYRVHGSAAVEPAYSPERRPNRQPKQQPRPNRRPAPRPKGQARQRMTVAPAALVGMGLAIFMLALVLFGYAQVYESASYLGQQEDLVAALQSENQKLQNQYDSNIDLESIEDRARELGMQQPTDRQTIYLQIPAEDTAVISAQPPANPIQAAWSAIVETVKSLWAYLH